MRWMDNIKIICNALRRWTRFSHQSSPCSKRQNSLETPGGKAAISGTLKRFWRTALSQSKSYHLFTIYQSPLLLGE